MQLCCRSWRIIFWMTNPQFPGPGSPGNPECLGLYETEHYLGPEQNCSGRWPLPKVKDFVEACWSTLLYIYQFIALPSTTNSFFCHHSEIQSIRWQMDRHHHLTPAHRHQCALSLPTTYSMRSICVMRGDFLFVIEDAMSSVADVPNMLTSCPLTAAQQCTKVSVGHYASLWEWDPTASRWRVMVHIDRHVQRDELFGILTWDLKETY